MSHCIQTYPTVSMGLCTNRFRNVSYEKMYTCMSLLCGSA